MAGSESNTHVVTFHEVLSHELDAVALSREVVSDSKQSAEPEFNDPTSVDKRAKSMGLIGLSLSGGGVRSSFVLPRRTPRITSSSRLADRRLYVDRFGRWVCRRLLVFPGG